jgi:hypothetical protein
MSWYDGSSKYFDKWGRIHDKPCVNNEPSSNNGWIYTAYASRVHALQVFDQKTCDALEVCWANKTRHPENNTVPTLSRDEILGMIWLDCILSIYTQGKKSEKSMAVNLIDGDFWMTNNRPILNPFKFIAQLVLLIINRKDRNYWWKNNLDQMKFLSMRLPIHDRAFVYRVAGKHVPLLWELIERIDRKLKPSSRSGYAIRSFKYDMNGFEGIRLYFSEDHPIRKFMEERK